MKYFVESAFLPEGWAENVRVTVLPSGRIKSVESGVKPSLDDQVLHKRVLLPALSNLHSHSFQRAMSGLTEKRLEKRDNFWSWRELMYRFLEHLTPEHLEAVAALVFMEMLECGYAAVGEFHYVHHQRGGKHYENIAETSVRIISAAQEAGIGLSHLPVFYLQGGLGGKPLAENQLRFANETAHFFRILEQTQIELRNAAEDFVLGVAPHSLRAVSPQALSEVVGVKNFALIHIHIAEQLQEVEDIQNYFGARPVEWLLENVEVDARWCLVHATHMTPEETQNLAKSGAVAGLCPLTEADLGDGVFDGPAWLAEKGKFGIGSDSNVCISLSEELRMLEYSQRLVRKERNLMANNSGSVGQALYENALCGGAQALGRKSGSIAPGNWADLLTLDSEALALCACAEDEIFDRWIFSANDSPVREVWSAGRQTVINGQHIRHHEIERKYRSVLKELQI